MRHPGSRMSTPVPPPGSRCKQFELVLPLVSPEGLQGDESPESEALREHLESCAYCRTALALYDVQAASLRRSHAERIAASPSFAADIFSRIEEVPVVSRLPEHSTSGQEAATPLAQTSHTHDGNDMARRRLDAARLAMNPPKRSILTKAAWLSPLAAVLLLAILAAVFFSAQHAGRLVATSPTTLPYAPGVGFEITAMSMTSPGEGWAIVSGQSAGSTCPSCMPQYLLHDHHGVWSPVALSSTTPLTDISMVSATDGWAVGWDGLILHYNGRDWTSVASPTTEQLLSIRMLSATDGWASGDTMFRSDVPLILHYDGQQWATQPMPSLALAPAGWPETWFTSSIQTAPDGEVWALTKWYLVCNGAVPIGPPPPNLSGTAILHYDGHQWQVQMSISGVLLGDLTMDSAQDGWVVGSAEPSNTDYQACTSATPVSGTSAQAPLFYHYTQGRWERSLLPLPASSGSSSALPAGGGSNSGQIVGTLTMVSPSDGWMLAATYSYPPVGSAYHFTQGRWLPATLPTLTTPQGWEPYGIYFQPDGSGWIFGTASKTLTPKGKAPFVSWVPLLLRYSGGTWSIQLD